jgi:hypothetical protein
MREPNSPSVAHVGYDISPLSRVKHAKYLIANPTDWLYAACLEYFNFSRSTVQKLENNMMEIF